jgi:hypothetical protein
MVEEKVWDVGVDARSTRIGMTSILVRDILMILGYLSSLRIVTSSFLSLKGERSTFSSRWFAPPIPSILVR